MSKVTNFSSETVIQIWCFKIPSFLQIFIVYLLSATEWGFTGEKICMVPILVRYLDLWG